MSGQFAVSMPILTLLAKANDERLTSDCIVGSTNINPVLARKEISNLRKKGLILSQENKNGGSTLVKPADQIRISDVSLATRQGPFLGKTQTTPSPDCQRGQMDPMIRQAKGFDGFKRIRGCRRHLPVDEAGWLG